MLLALCADAGYPMTIFAAGWYLKVVVPLVANVLA